MRLGRIRLSDADRQLAKVVPLNDAIAVRAAASSRDARSLTCAVTIIVIPGGVAGRSQDAGPLLDLVAKDKRAERAAAGMQRLPKEARRSKIALLFRPPIPGRFWPIGATVVPPYDTQTAWSVLADGSVTPLANAESADPNSGNMSIEL